MLTDSDTELVEDALAGGPAACAYIRSHKNTRYLESLLIKRGASRTEATDIVGDLFADCFGAKAGKIPLLRKFTGKGSLRAFLSRAAINRLIDLKRHQRFEGELPSTSGEQKSTDPFDLLAGEPPALPEDQSITSLLQRALARAVQACDPLALMLLQLVALRGVNQTTAGKIIGWSQSKVSRTLTDTMKTIREITLREVHTIDPHLDLEWSDFLTLCRQSISAES